MQRTSLFLYSVVIVTLLLGLSACLNSGSVDPGLSPNTEASRKAPGIENDANGTSDGGGGFVDYSTDEDIKEAVEKVKEIMLKEDFIQRFLGRQPHLTFDRFFGTEDDSIDSGEVYTLFRKIMRPRIFAISTIMNDLVYIEGHDHLGDNFEYVDKEIRLTEGLEKYVPRWDEAKKLPERLKDYLNSIPIEFIDEGACKHSGDYEADASVDSYTFDATICMSLERLRRLPPSALEAHIFGILLHEIGHMTGEKREWVVKALERVAILSYHKLVFGNVTRRLWMMTRGSMSSNYYMLQELKVAINEYYNPIDENTLWAIQKGTKKLWELNPLMDELEYVAREPGVDSNSTDYKELLKMKNEVIIRLSSNTSIFRSLIDPFPATDVFPDIDDIERRDALYERSDRFRIRIGEVMEMSEEVLFSEGFYKEVDFLYRESGWLHDEFTELARDAFKKRNSVDGKIRKNDFDDNSFWNSSSD